MESQTENLVLKTFAGKDKAFVKSLKDVYEVQQKMYQIMGEVDQYFFQCWSQKNKNQMSIRIIAIDLAHQKNEKQATFLQRENLNQIKIQRLDCQNIAKVYDNFGDDKFHFMVQELLDTSLLSYIKTKPGEYLIDQEVFSFAKQMMNAVTCIHQIGIYHRGLNLESFRLDKDNILKLGDFLLSKGFDQEDDKQTNCKIESDPFINQNFGKSSKQEALKDDYYSFGVILFAMLMGPYFPFQYEDKNKKLITLPLHKSEKEFTPQIRYFQAYKKQIFNWDLVGLDQQIIRPYVSEQVQKFIEQLLVGDNEKRLDLQQILNHPVMANDQNFLKIHNEFKIVGEKSFEDLAKKLKNNYFLDLHRIENPNVSIERVSSSAIKMNQKSTLDPQQAQIQMEKRKGKQFFIQNYFQRINRYRSIGIAIYQMLKSQQNFSENRQIILNGCRIMIDYLQTNYLLIIQDIEQKKNSFKFEGNKEHIYDQIFILNFLSDIKSYYEGQIIYYQQTIHEQTQSIPQEQHQQIFNKFYKEAVNRQNKGINTQDIYFILHSITILQEKEELKNKEKEFKNQEFLVFFEEIKSEEQKKEYNRYSPKFLSQIQLITEQLQFEKFQQN